MLGRRELRSIKAGGWLVNVSRSGIVYEDSLLEALREGHLAGAVVDVFAIGPLPPDSPFWICRTCWSRRTFLERVRGLAGCSGPLVSEEPRSLDAANAAS
jgi:lactate dehydrogenase-like 2-hydroxyacid dehydrogenase